MNNVQQQPGEPYQTDPSQVHLDTPLFNYTDRDSFTYRDAFEGTIITGISGTWKTTGTRQLHIRAMLRAGFGGLCLCVKANERDRFLEWCRQEGRSDSVIVVSPENGQALNFLQYELSRPGRGSGMTQNLTKLFATVLEQHNSQGTHVDPFWPNAANQLLRNLFDALRLATNQVTLPAMVKMLRSAPRSVDDVSSKHWRQHSFCYRILQRASGRQLNRVDRGDLRQTLGYWLDESPRQADKMRSSIISMFTSMADTLLRGQLREMFCRRTTFLPELMEMGFIILIDIPTKEYHEAGHLAQNIVKLVFQRYWESRVKETSAPSEQTKPTNLRPCFLDVDESQNFISSQDATFLQTAREARVATIFVTPNIPNYYAAFGGRDGKDRVDSLLGNIGTKVFHANSDTTTNTYAENLIGKEWKSRFGINIPLGGQGTPGANFNQSYDSILPASFFTTLARGEAIVHKAGRQWSDPKAVYLRVKFPQEF